MAITQKTGDQHPPRVRSNDITKLGPGQQTTLVHITGVKGEVGAGRNINKIGEIDAETIPAGKRPFRKEKTALAGDLGRQQEIRCVEYRDLLDLEAGMVKMGHAVQGDIDPTAFQRPGRSTIFIARAASGNPGIGQ